MNDVTVVYIAGYGRSGSTLLDLLLGRLDGWFSMGEFRHFPHALRDDYTCGCGTPVAACPVWSNVVARAQLPAAEALIADRREVLRVRRLAGLLRPALLGGHRGAHERAIDAIAQLYRATADVTGARALVDSSKDPLYGLLLAAAPGIRLHVVHLVRDSRAVAWSWQRRRARPEIASGDAYLPVHSSTHSALEWDLRNGLAHVLATRAASATRVTYEALVRDPPAVVAAAARALGIDARDVEPAEEPVNHTVGGNPMRFAGPVTVKADDEWRAALPAREGRVVTAITAPLLRAYGYRLRRGDNATDRARQGGR
jgi:hypothetical protein